MPPKQQPPDDRFHLIVSVDFFRTEEGGRKTPVTSDYRPNCWFGERRDGQRLYHDFRLYFRPGDGAFEDKDKLWVSPGGSCHAVAFPFHPSYVRPLAYAGMTFDISEGHRVVARATVDDIFDPGPEYDDAKRPKE